MTRNYLDQICEDWENNTDDFQDFDAPDWVTGFMSRQPESKTEPEPWFGYAYVPTRQDLEDWSHIPF